MILWVVYNADTTQAASAIDNLKMNESPIKKINFAEGKENAPVDTTWDASIPKPLILKGIHAAGAVEVKPVEKTAIASTLNPEEADEPLLQENPNRFVLFPIKYHEVSYRVRTRPA